jgi:hypothetical protein
LSARIDVLEQTSKIELEEIRPGLPGLSFFLGQNLGLDRVKLEAMPLSALEGWRHHACGSSVSLTPLHKGMISQERERWRVRASISARANGLRVADLNGLLRGDADEGAGRNVDARLPIEDAPGHIVAELGDVLTARTLEVVE